MLLLEDVIGLSGWDCEMGVTSGVLLCALCCSCRHRDQLDSKENVGNSPSLQRN